MPSKAIPATSIVMLLPGTAAAASSAPSSAVAYPTSSPHRRPNRDISRDSTIAPAPVPATPAVFGSPAHAVPIASAATSVLTALAAAMAAFINAAEVNKATRLPLRAFMP